MAATRRKSPKRPFKAVIIGISETVHSLPLDQASKQGRDKTPVFYTYANACFSPPEVDKTGNGCQNPFGVQS